MGGEEGGIQSDKAVTLRFFPFFSRPHRLIALRCQMIRYATPEDTDGLLALLNEAFAGKKTFTRDYVTEPNDGRFLVAIANEAGREVIAGCVVFDPGPEQSEFSRAATLNWLAVGSAFRRRGFGRALLRDAETRARRAGAARIDAMTQSDNRETLNLCFALGYKDRFPRPLAPDEVVPVFLEKCCNSGEIDDEDAHRHRAVRDRGRAKLRRCADPF